MVMFDSCFLKLFFRTIFYNTKYHFDVFLKMFLFFKFSVFWSLNFWEQKKIGVYVFFVLIFLNKKQFLKIVNEQDVCLPCSQSL